MQTLNTVGSFLKSKKTLSQLHIVYFAFESKCKYMEELEFVCDSPQYTMKLITYGDGLRYRWLETYGGVLSYRGLHETGVMQKHYNISCVI